MKKGSFTQLIKEEAFRLGFDDFGVAEAGRLDQEEHYLAHWLGNRFHAEMGYMAKNRDKRIDPTKLMENVRSVVCLLSNYKPAKWSAPAFPQIASFAYGLDYHIVLKERLHLVQNFVNNRAKANMRLFTDTAPILERAWAVRAGLGWTGKSTLLISPKFGPFTFISIILIDLELEYDTPMEAQCGSCTGCLQACPTGALCAPYTLDARRCISYHTIENKSPCTVATEPYIFGCDACIRACPWGKETPATTLFPPLPDILELTAQEWKDMSSDQFIQRFGRSALLRAGISKIQNTLSLWNGKPK